ncbi:MAG: two-component regulator propeller domain-containing protein [Verrucomicrobiota bacterium]
MQAADGAAPAEDFLVQVWDTDSGLPHSTVTSIAQTPDGYLWVGTLNGGLARFDGVRFVSFHAGNTPELRSIEIQKLLVDSQGTLWVGTVEGALVSYRDGRFRFERQSPEMPEAWLGRIVSSGSNSVALSSIFGWIFHGARANGTNRWETVRPPDADHGYSLCGDPQGSIWYRTPGGQLGQVRSNQFVPVLNPPGLRSRQINTLINDRAGLVWVGTEKEIARWDGRMFVSQVPTNGEPDLAVHQMAACPDGTLWVETDREFRKCRGQQWVARVESWDGEGLRSSPFPVSTFGDSLSIFGDSRGGLWVLHHGDGLWHADANGRVSRVRETQGLPNALVECWFEDHEGNVWIGLNGGGLACVRVRPFHTVWPTGGETRLAARSICEDQAGTMWFGTPENTLLRWRNGEFTSFTPPIEPAVGRYLTVFPGDAGRLWVGGVQNGVVTLADEKFSRPFPSDDIGTVARVIYKDRSGRIWFGSEFGLFCWELGRLKRFTAADGFTPAYVLAIAEDKAGNLWIGTALGELRQYRAGRFITYWPEDSPTEPQAAAAAAAAVEGAKPLQNRSRGALTGGERFWALYADNEGVVWIGTLGGGLLRFQEGKFTRYTPREGLPNEHVSQILEDDRGQLWLGTRSGIARVSKETLNQFARGEMSYVRFVTYGKSDGLPAAECVGGSQPACWRSRDGHLWFATIKGAVWTDPAEVRSNPLPPPVLIEEVLVNGQRLAEDGQPSGSPAVRVPPWLKVPAGHHYLDFKFTALSLTSPDKVRFKWRLAGLEKDWVIESSRRSVSYSFVPPGEYEFQVQACNNDGIWNEAGAAIKLTVQPYFWQTWWFKILMVLLVVAILGVVYSVRVARLRSLQRLRLRIARDLHDDVGANLGSISLLAQMMEKHPSSDDATQVRGIAMETMDTLRDIVWFIDPQHDRLSDLVTRLSETARNMLRHSVYQFEESGDFSSTKLPLAFRRNVPPIFKEALHNVLKHAHATEVRISVRRWEDKFQFRITDNGIGFDESTASAGNGLKNMRRRVADIGGQLEIARQPGGGTAVTLTAPITQTRDWQ